VCKGTTHAAPLHLFCSSRTNKSLRLEIGNLFFLERVLQLEDFMFWKRVEYIFEWTVQTPWTQAVMVEIRGLMLRMVRAVFIGVGIGLGAYAVCGLILPDLELPWTKSALSAIGYASVIGLIGAAVSRIEKPPKRKYSVSETFLRLPDGKQARFRACIAYFVNLTKTRLELVPRQGYVISIELPEDRVLSEAIIAFIMARVPRWTHPEPEAPHELSARAGELRGRLLLAYWAATLLGSVVVAANLVLPSSVPADNIIYILFGAYVVGPGVLWGWSAWHKLAAFPWYWRLRVALTLNLIGNMVWAGLFQQFLIAFAITRIVP
jgi:hypothetical protein